MNLLLAASVSLLSLSPAVSSKWCSWSQWKCSEGKWKEGSFQCTDMYRSRGCCGEGDSGCSKRETATAERWGEMGLECRVRNSFMNVPTCAGWAHWDVKKFPKAEWCEWLGWTDWRLECTERLGLKNVSEHGVHVRKRQRFCRCPYRVGGCSGSYGDMDWRPLSNMSADSCWWCSWQSWGSCKCLYSATLPRERFRRCVCPDGSLRYTKDVIDFKSLKDKSCKSQNRLYSRGSYETGKYGDCSFSRDCKKKETLSSWSSWSSSDESYEDDVVSGRKKGLPNSLLVVLVVVIVILTVISVCYKLNRGSAARGATPVRTYAYTPTPGQEVQTPILPPPLPSAPVVMPPIQVSAPQVADAAAPPPSYEDCVSSPDKYQ